MYRWFYSVVKHYVRSTELYVVLYYWGAPEYDGVYTVYTVRSTVLHSNFPYSTIYTCFNSSMRSSRGSKCPTMTFLPRGIQSTKKKRFVVSARLLIWLIERKRRPIHSISTHRLILLQPASFLELVDSIYWEKFLTVFLLRKVLFIASVALTWDLSQSSFPQFC